MGEEGEEGSPSDAAGTGKLAIAERSVAVAAPPAEDRTILVAEEGPAIVVAEVRVYVADNYRDTVDCTGSSCGARAGLS